MREYQKDFITLYDDFQDGENRKRKAEKINYVLEKLRLHNPQGTCLDTGCSNGIITKSMASVFSSVVGVDIDMTAMKLVDARELPNVRYVYGDAMGLPFADGSYEALICSQTYEHVPSSPRLFEEILLFALKLLSPFMVNINWVLDKREAGKNGARNIQFAR